jgi:hypothetical protein
VTKSAVSACNGAGFCRARSDQDQAGPWPAARPLSEAFPIRLRDVLALSFQWRVSNRTLRWSPIVTILAFKSRTNFAKKQGVESTPCGRASLLVSGKRYSLLARQKRAASGRTEQLLSPVPHGGAPPEIRPKLCKVNGRLGLRPERAMRYTTRDTVVILFVLVVNDC